MDEKIIPYIVYVYESALARMERTVKRLFALCLVLIAVFIVWIRYESQFEDIVTTQEITQDVDSGDGGDAIINDGVYVYGASETDG